MSCAQEQELTAYVDGELSVSEMADMKAHLDECPDCQKTEALLRRTVARVAELPEYEPSPSARRAMLTRLDQVKDPWRVRLKAVLRPLVLVPTMGLVVTALVVGVMVLRTTRRGATAMDAPQLELAQNLELAENYEVLGLSSPDDIEVVAHLKELEGKP